MFFEQTKNSTVLNHHFPLVRIIDSQQHQHQQPSHQQLHQQQQLQQHQQQHAGLHEILSHSSPLTGAISRTPARLPEDVTALADRDNVGKDRDGVANKNAVTKTYHTLKDLISSKFKKDNNEVMDELNNVVVHQQQQQPTEDMTFSSSTYRGNHDFNACLQESALPMHMRSMNQSQPNILASGGGMSNGNGNIRASNGRNYIIDSPLSRPSNGVQQRALSQPHLNVQPTFERHNSQPLLDQIDSDDGGFAARLQGNRKEIVATSLRTDNEIVRMPKRDIFDFNENNFVADRGESGRIDWRETVRDGFQMQSTLQQNALAGGLQMRSSPQQLFQNASNLQGINGGAFGQHQHQGLNGQHFNVNSQMQQQNQPLFSDKNSFNLMQHQQQTQVKIEQEIGQMQAARQDAQRSSFQKRMQENNGNQLTTTAAVVQQQQQTQSQ